jgi:hypothetical protein
MRRSAIVAIAGVSLAVAFARCGPESITSGDIAPPPDGGFTVAPADAGTPDAGTAGSDGGTSGTPDAGNGGGGGGGGGDGGGGGGGPSADACAGILPGASQQAVFVDVPHSPGQACFDVTVDLAGNVAADLANGPWSTYSSSGAALGSGVPAGSLWPQQQGYEGVRANNNVPTLFLWNANTSVASSTPVGTGSSRVSVWGSGPGNAPHGVVVVTQDCGGPSNGTTLSRFDAQGHLAAAQHSGDAPCASAAAIADANDNTLLVVWPGNSVGLGGDEFAARWFGPDEKPLTGWFSAGRGDTGNSSVVLRPVIGGGAAMQVNANWTQTFRSGVASADAPFPWLTAQTDLMTIREGRGYAVVSRGSDNRDVVQLYSVSGQSCGAVRFSTQGLGVGPDGTVIGSQGDNGCTHPFWPGLLR